MKTHATVRDCVKVWSTMLDNAEKLLSRSEVEAEFGITRRFLEICAWRGDGPPMIKLGRRTVRYRRGDLLAWIEAQRVDHSDNAA
jgi:predicted DNA-binding transcriptional regulator AlpA